MNDMVSNHLSAASEHDSNIQARQSWMATLSTARPADVQALWDKVPDQSRPSTDMLRPPETGLVMVKGRAGGTGSQFNMGEMTVTRCAVRLDSGVVGLSYLKGRDKQHALIAATVDAMMQSIEHADLAETTVVTPLRQAEQTERETLARKTEATRVNFFTMVRSRQDK